jgi:hypothetical protein
LWARGPRYLKLLDVVVLHISDVEKRIEFERLFAAV